MWINDTQRRRFASMWPCAAPEKKEQTFKRAIHFSVKTAEIASNPETPELSVRVSG